MNHRQVIPFCFTAAALLAGFFSILKSVTGDYLQAAQFIMLAMALDGLDGNVARWLKGTSQFGAEMDTFVDLTSFGIAPAVLVYQLVFKEYHFWGLLMVSAIVLSGTMRLSRFRTVDPHRGQKGFLGLPITVCAGWMALFVFISESGLFDETWVSLHHGIFAAFVWTCTVAMLILQVSQVHYHKPTKELIFFLPSLCLIGFLFMKVHIGAAAALAMCAYGFAYAFISPFVPRHHMTMEESEEDEPVSIID